MQVFLLIVPITLILIAYIRKEVRKSRERAAVMNQALTSQKKKVAEANRPREEVQREKRRAMMERERRLMTASMRYEVLRRDNFRCKLCGATAKDGVKLHVDHIKPVSRGGKTEMSNLRTLCERCNLGKGAKQE